MLTLTTEAGPDPTSVVLVFAVLLYLVGVFGIIFPVLPGLLVCVTAVLLWAVGTSGSLAWGSFGVVLALYLCGLTLQYLIPGRNMKRAGVSTSTLLLGLVAAVVGFFVIPLLGAPVGFVLGIFGVELLRYRDRERAWAMTKSAVRGVLHSMGIELSAAFFIAVVWIGGILLH